MDRVLQSLRVGPHRVDVVEIADEQGGGYVMVLVDGAVVTEAPLEQPPTREEVLELYARWAVRRRGPGGGTPGPRGREPGS